MLVEAMRTLSRVVKKSQVICERNKKYLYVVSSYLLKILKCQEEGITKKPLGNLWQRMFDVKFL